MVIPILTVDEIKKWIDNDKANDLMTLLSTIPPGQVKQLLKDEACKTILEKYGITKKE